MLGGHEELAVLVCVLPTQEARRVLHLLERVDHRVGLTGVRVEQAVRVEAGVRGPI